MFGFKHNGDTMWHENKSDRRLLEALIEDAIYKNEVLETLMGDFTALNAAQAQLDADVATLIAQGSGTSSDQASIDSATSATQATDAKVVAAIGGSGVLPGNGVPEVDAAGNPVLDANGVQLIGVPVVDANGNAVLDAGGNPTYTTVATGAVRASSLVAGNGDPATTPNMIHG